MKDLKDLHQYWRDYHKQPLMLCTIVGKTGSGYRDIGAKKIIRHNGESSGYLSGGCLEKDIVLNVQENWDKVPFIKSFSTMSKEDRLLGYQSGCAGVINVLFERLPTDLSAIENYIPYGEKKDIAAIAVALDPKRLGQRTALKSVPASDAAVFIDPWIEPFNLYIVGSGPDAFPFAILAPTLGWNLTFIDYREGKFFPRTEGVVSKILPVSEIGDAIPAGGRTAVVVMTHNYEADLRIIGQLNNKQFAYIGAIGPRKRFEQIAMDLEKLYNITLDLDWSAKIHAPAGMKKGRTPADIALAIVAEICFGMAT